MKRTLKKKSNGHFDPTMVWNQKIK